MKKKKSKKERNFRIKGISNPKVEGFVQIGDHKIPRITTEEGIDFKCSICGEWIDDSREATDRDTAEMLLKLKPYGLTFESEIVIKTYLENRPICDHCLFSEVIKKLNKP